MVMRGPGRMDVTTKSKNVVWRCERQRKRAVQMLWREAELEMCQQGRHRLMWKACIATRVHGGAKASAASKEHVWVHGPTASVLIMVSVAYVFTKNHEHACGLDCYLRPCWCVRALQSWCCPHWLWECWSQPSWESWYQWQGQGRAGSAFGGGGGRLS